MIEKRLDGRLVAEKILQTMAQEVQKFRGACAPKVAFVRVGEDPASVSYIHQKRKTAERVGIETELRVLSTDVSFAALAAQIEELNEDPRVHGILIQSPLPQGLDFSRACDLINPAKDVDGFGKNHLGELMRGNPSGFIPCTPAGIIELLKHYRIQTTGKHVVILNRSLIVGKPLGLLLLERGPFGDATVTFAHSKTRHLSSRTREADILITACGQPRLITPEFVQEGAVVIDVGITRQIGPNGRDRLQGDVDFEAVYPKVSHITPVPGGVGPLTVALLMRNTLKAYGAQIA
jgi:methylenetetrahydrofolate dehydrogenase (NADP+)/methenyltetrahydrofolate cyclohydrolase